MDNMLELSNFEDRKINNIASKGRGIKYFITPYSDKIYIISILKDKIIKYVFHIKKYLKIIKKKHDIDVNKIFDQQLSICEYDDLDELNNELSNDLQYIINLSDIDNNKYKGFIICKLKKTKGIRPP